MYATQLPVEHASDQLDLIQSIAAGAATMEKNQQQDHIRRLQRVANDQPAKPAEPDELRALGITVEEV